MQTFAEWVGGLSWGGVPLKNMSVSRDKEIDTCNDVLKALHPDHARAAVVLVDTHVCRR